MTSNSELTPGPLAALVAAADRAAVSRPVGRGRFHGSCHSLREEPLCEKIHIKQIITVGLERVFQKVVAILGKIVYRLVDQLRMEVN